MKNGEVLDTNACGELVMNNTVEDGCDDASDRDFKGFHRVLGVEQILIVVTSRLRSKPPTKAKGKRKLARTPGFVNHPLGVVCRLFNLCGLLPDCTPQNRNVPERLLLLQLALR